MLPAQPIVHTTLYYANVTVHVLAALLWLGGMFFLAAVGAPVLRAVEPPLLRQQLFRMLGTRFRRAGWLAIALLVATGVGNLYFRGWLHASVLGDAAFWRGGTGTALGVKLACVATMIALSAVHDFVLGPRAGRASPGSEQALRLRRLSSWTARVEALVGLVLVVAAVRLAR